MLSDAILSVKQGTNAAVIEMASFLISEKKKCLTFALKTLCELLSNEVYLGD